MGLVGMTRGTVPGKTWFSVNVRLYVAGSAFV